MNWSSPQAQYAAVLARKGGRSTGVAGTRGLARPGTARVGLSVDQRRRETRRGSGSHRCSSWKSTAGRVPCGPWRRTLPSSWSRRRDRRRSSRRSPPTCLDQVGRAGRRGGLPGPPCGSGWTVSTGSSPRPRRSHRRTIHRPPRIGRPPARAVNVPSARTCVTTSVNSSHCRVPGNHALYAASFAQNAIRPACQPAGKSNMSSLAEHELGHLPGERQRAARRRLRRTGRRCPAPPAPPGSRGSGSGCRPRPPARSERRRHR